MRLSTVLRFSFVGALMFTPAMADDIDQVHEQALKVLRDQSAPTPAKPASAPAAVSPGVDNRDALRKQQAADAEQRRQQQQEERRRKFEQEVQQRELLRQQQRQHDENVARQVGVKQPSAISPDEVHQRALDILRGNESAPSAPAAPVQPAPISPAPQPVPAAVQQPISPVQPAAQPEDIQQRARDILRQQQQEMQRSPSSVQFVAPGQNRVLTAEPTPDEQAIHQRALDILHGNQQAPSAATTTLSPVVTTAPTQTTTITTTPAPAVSVSPQPAPSTLTGSSPSTESADAVHQRALEVLRQQNAQPQPVVSRGLDPKTQEILRRQDQELSRQVGSSSSQLPPASNPSIAVTTAPVSNPSTLPQHELAPEMEARARELLRQQEAASGVTQAPTTSSVAVAPSSNAPQIQYSQELENKARQTILQNSGAQQPVAASNNNANTAAPVVTPVPQNNTAATSSSSGITPSDADVAAIHAKALDTMEHAMNPSPAEQTSAIISAPKPKREKLQELTELYKADKLTPAQYHEARAKILSQAQ